MKTLWIGALVSLCLAVPSAIADFAIYKGSFVVKETSAELIQNAPVKTFTAYRVIDLTGKNFKDLYYEGKGEARSFRRGEAVDLTLETVQDPKKDTKEYTVAAFVLKEPNFGGSTATVVSSLLMKGLNSNIPISAISNKTAPKTLAYSGFGLLEAGSLNETPFPASLQETKGKFVLQSTLSQQANNETVNFDAAVEVVAQELVEQGYTDNGPN